MACLNASTCLSGTRESKASANRRSSFRKKNEIKEIAKIAMKIFPRIPAKELKKPEINETLNIARAFCERNS